MIPAVLTLRNFLCYQENCPPLDFSGIRVACLTGENGNGKSALLDAMTWALWGQARARTDDELIHLGRSEMEVEFEFLCDGQRYRVIRKRRKGTQRSSGATALEFHLASPAGWKPLTANHIRDTEAQIRHVLKLDYETFVNSAFLMQGKADAFTVKSPGERKRILGEILGLSQYDELEQEARYERGLRDDRARGLQREIALLEEALRQQPAYLDEQQSLRLTLVEIESQLQRAASTLERLRQAERLRALQRQQAEAAERRRLEAAGEVERAEHAIDDHRCALARYDVMIRDDREIESGYRNLQTAIEQERGHGERLSRHAALTQQRAQCQAAIERARSRLTADEEACSALVQRLTVAAAEPGGSDADCAALDARSRDLDINEQRTGTLRGDEQRLREDAGALRLQNAALRTQMESIKRKQTDLSGATVCPVCKTELGAEGQAHVIQSYEQEGRSLAAQFRENRGRIQEQEDRATALHLELETEETRLRAERTALARDEAAFEAVARRVAEAGEQLHGETRTLAQLREHIERGDYAIEEHGQLGRVDVELSAVGYDEGGHARVRLDLERLRPYDQRHRDLQLARAQRQTAAAALETSCRLLRDWQQRLTESAEECARLQSVVDGGDDGGAELGEAEHCHELLQLDQRRYQQALGAVAQKLDDCGRQRREHDGKQADLLAALEERRIYEELAGAFSRRGIQALIIDHAIPEITEEANRLLARMTNNRMRVAMDTQRQTQKGAVAETLDIRIADEVGTRNYELFSGGEAFRINLALRIALSKLLARRAGAPLPTLVIDEGFGSQDPAALERLIEAINVIQDDFECLLIVTHLAELRDQFPVQIAVSKSAEGALAAISV